MDSIFEKGGFLGFYPDFLTEDKHINGYVPTLVDYTPEFVGSSTFGNTGGSTTHVVDLTTLTGGIDTRPRTGDLVIIAFAPNSGANRTFSANNSFISLVDLYSNSGVDSNLFICYKVMGATPDTSVTITQSASSANQGEPGLVYVLRNVNTTTPLDVTTTTASGTTAAINPPAITPSSARSVIVAIGGSAHGGGLINYSSSNLINTNQLSINTTYDATVFAGMANWTSGAFNPATLTGFTGSSSDAWTAATLAIRPKASETLDLPVYGNLKNSGLWSLKGVYDGLVNKPAGFFEASYITNYDLGAPGGSTIIANNVNIGSADSNRIVAIAVSYNVGANTTGKCLTSATIGGIAATVLETTDPAGWERSAVIYAVVPTGTTAQVSLNFNVNINQRCVIGIYRIVNSNSVVFAYDANNNTNVAYSTSVNVNQGDFVIAALATGNTATTFSNITQDYSYNVSSAFLKGASISASSSGLLTIGNSANTYGILTTVAFRRQ